MRRCVVFMGSEYEPRALLHGAFSELAYKGL